MAAHNICWNVRDEIHILLENDLTEKKEESALNISSKLKHNNLC